MTDKQIFLDKLKAALFDRDISEVDIAPYIERFDRYYDRMVNDLSRSDADLLADIDSIADNIADQIAERYDSINALAERTMSMDSVPDGKPTGQASPPAEAADTGRDASADGSDSGLVSFVPEEAESDPNEPATAEYTSALIDRAEPPPAEAEDNPPSPSEYIDEEPSPNSSLFWILFAVSLPLTVPLGLAAVSVFLTVWAVLALLALTAIAALIAVSAAGTAVSLVGIIYGISRLFTELPVGLYELGLGVMVAGAVMFVGILLYNFAVRLLPRLTRLVGRLFGYCMGRLRMLFNHLRRECAKL